MNRFVRLALGVLAGAVVGGCGALRVAPSANNPGMLPVQAPLPDLSTKNYVATYPLAGETPNYIATGSDGNLWVTTAHDVVKVTPSGSETFISNSAGFATHIAAGKTGVLWFTNLNGNIGKITVAGTITSFAVPGASNAFDIAKGPDGNMWFTERGTKSIGVITPAGTSSLFALPSGATPIGIAAGPDGNLWFSATGGTNGEEIGKITTAHVFTEFALPNGSPIPGAMAKGPDGNLYATSSSGGLIQTTTSGVSTVYPTSFSANFENGIAVGPDKQVWIAPGDAADDLVEFDTNAHTYSKAATVPRAPFCGSSLTAVPRGLALGPDGDMWFVTIGCAYVGSYEEKLSTVGVRLNGESSINHPPYGFELGYFNGTTSTVSETVSLGMGESVQFRNVDATASHTASFLGDASVSGAPWPSHFNGSSTQSPAGTAIGTTGFSTGLLNAGQKSLIYETGLPGFYMMGCAIHYDSNSVRTVIVVH